VKPRRYYSTNLSDEEWEILKPLVPEATPAGAGATSPPDLRALGRHLLRGERRMRSASASLRFPYSRQVAYHSFRAWRIDGTWERIHTTTLRERTRLREGRPATPSTAILDSQSVRTTENGGCEDAMEPRRQTGANRTFWWMRAGW
jgi:putative transposase